MIKVGVKYINDKVVSISLSGHADSAEYGHDLICASATSIMVGGANALMNITSFNVRLDEGNVYIRLKENHELSKHDEIVMETILCQLKTLEEGHEKFIKIEKL